MLRPILLCCLAALAGCAEFPKLDAAVGPEAKHAAYPALAPLSGIIDQPADGTDATASEDPSSSLKAQAAALRAKAKALYATPVNGG